MRVVRASIVALVALSAPAVAQQSVQLATTQQVEHVFTTQQQQMLVTEVRLFELKYMTNEDAAKLIAPFVEGFNGGVFEAGSTVRGVTVRSTKSSLARIDSLIAANDVAAATVVLRFYVIAAIDTAMRDPEIPAALDAALREMFSFKGYRIVGDGISTVSDRGGFSLTLGNSTHFQAALSGNAYINSTLAGRGAGRTPTSVMLSVSLSTQRARRLPDGSIIDAQKLLSTEVSVPIGQTVALGSAVAWPGARALILTVLPEPAGSAGARR